MNFKKVHEHSIVDRKYLSYLLLDDFSGSVDDSKVARRHRISPYPLISVDEAVQIVLKHADLQATEKIYFKGWCDLVTVTLLKRKRMFTLDVCVSVNIAVKL